MIDQGTPEVEPGLAQEVALSSGEIAKLEIEKPDYGHTPVVVQIETGRVGENRESISTYSVIDMRSADLNEDGTKRYMGYSFDPNLDFLIVSQAADFDRMIGYKGLRMSEGEIQLGRFDSETMPAGDVRSRFHNKGTTSRNHFSIQATDEGLAIKDTDSLHGTTIKVDTGTDLKIVEASHEEDIVAMRNNARTAIAEYLAESKDDQYLSYKRTRLQEISDKILASADATLANEVAEVIVNQSLDGVPLTRMLGRWNIHEQYDKRIRVLSILERDPDAARAIVVNKIGGFHGSQSGSLWGVLEHDGLLSAAEARTRGQVLVNGERTYSKKEGQSMISFADYREAKSIAQYAGVETNRISVEVLQDQYAQLVQVAQENEAQWGPEHPFTYNAKNVAGDVAAQIEFMKENPNSLETWLMQENFPIAYGLSLEGLDTVQTLADKDNKGKIVERVPSGIEGEFLFMDDHVSLDRIPVVAVPKPYMEYVQRIFADRGKSVRIIDISLLTE